VVKAAFRDRVNRLRQSAPPLFDLGAEPEHCFMGE